MTVVHDHPPITPDDVAAAAWRLSGIANRARRRQGLRVGVIMSGGNVAVDRFLSLVRGEH